MPSPRREKGGENEKAFIDSPRICVLCVGNFNSFSAGSKQHTHARGGFLGKCQNNKLSSLSLPPLFVLPATSIVMCVCRFEK